MAEQRFCKAKVWGFKSSLRLRVTNNMAFFKKYILLFIVFITGAAVLIVEVVALRILSPYYGNTIFTASSVISVILTGLSLGYYLGGHISDLHPSLKWFYGIILASGLSVFLLQLLIFLFLPTLGYNLSVISGPLLSAIILFFLPSFLLGTLSPFAIKLQSLKFPGEGIGKTTGKVFFWSTLGSIFGSLTAGFILIPRFGINQIIITVGFLLILIAVVAFLILGIAKKNIVKIFFIVIIAIGITVFLSIRTNPNVVYTRDGVYEKITIYDGKYNEKPTRFFQQDRSASGAMFLDSEELVYDYTKYYVLYRVLNPKVKEVLAIGGGAYSIPKAILKEISEANVDVIEIEPSLFELAKKFFKLPEDQRLKNYVGDGRRFLHDSNKKYDLIFSDVYYSLFSVPSHFTTIEFFQIAKEKLNTEGIFIANLVGDLSPQPISFIWSEIKTFKSVFPNSYFFAVGSPKSSRLQNIIFLGYNSTQKIDFENVTIKENDNEIIRNLSQKLIDVNKIDFSQYSKLTDNFAPVENLTAQAIERWAIKHY